MAHITIGTTATRADYTASAGQTAFSVPFEFFDEDDLLVYKNNVLLTKTTHYTVTPVTTSDGGFDGGTVTLTSGNEASINDKVAIVLSMPYERSSDFPTAGPFNVTTLNTTLDKNAVRFKQIDERVSRALTGPTSEAGFSELPAKADRASRIMSFDANGNPSTVATDSLSLATLQAFTDYKVTTGTGNGSNTTLTLSADPGQEGNTQVYIDGVYQSKSNYSISGTTLTFSTAPPNGSAIEVVHGQAASTYSPVAGSITFAHLADTIDEDNMSSNSATKIPTQQSVKAYVDAQVDTVDTLAEVLANGNGTGGTDIAVGANDDITLVDGSNIILGTSGDGFALYHNGSNSYITETGTGTGNLYVLATDLTLGDKGNQHHYAHFVSGGEAKLFYDNDLKYETTNGGGKVTGDLQITGGDIELGSGNDTTISRASAGVVTIEGQTVRTGTVAIANGGTGATTAAAAASAIGVGTEDSPTFTGLTLTGNADIDGTTNLDAVDIDGAVQIDSTVTVGVDDTGYDVRFYGDTASASVLWDASADDLIFYGAAGLVVPDSQLTLGSTTVTATASELNVLDAVTAGTVSASKAVVVDGNKDASGFRNLTLTGDITSTGNQITVGDNAAAGGTYDSMLK